MRRILFPTFKLGAAAPPAPFTAEAVSFDGTNDALTTTTGSWGSSNDQWSGSFWFYDAAHAVSGNETLISLATSGGQERARIVWQPGNTRFIIQAFDSSNALEFRHITATTGWTAGNWYHILWSFDGGASSSLCYRNGTDITTTPTNNGGNADWAGVDNGWIGRENAVASIDLNLDIAEFWMTNEYIDFSNASNRRLFSDQDGTGAVPISLGSDGSTPTGTQPLVYFKGAASVWNAGTNAGSVTGWSMAGAVTDSAQEPVQT